MVMIIMHHWCVYAVHCQRVSELNERYNSCRAKTADCVAAAVKHKEDVSHSADAFLHCNITSFALI